MRFNENFKKLQYYFDITVCFGYYIDRNKLKEGREKLEKVRMKEGRKSE